MTKTKKVPFDKAPKEIQECLKNLPPGSSMEWDEITEEKKKAWIENVKKMADYLKTEEGAIWSQVKAIELSPIDQESQKEELKYYVGQSVGLESNDKPPITGPYQNTQPKEEPKTEEIIEHALDRLDDLYLTDFNKGFINITELQKYTREIIEKLSEKLLEAYKQSLK